jgi:hypothetical protein
MEVNEKQLSKEPNPNPMWDDFWSELNEIVRNFRQNKNLKNQPLNEVLKVRHPQYRLKFEDTNGFLLTIEGIGSDPVESQYFCTFKETCKKIEIQINQDGGLVTGYKLSDAVSPIFKNSTLKSDDVTIGGISSTIKRILYMS